MKILDKIKNEVIVSVQAMPLEPLYKEECMIAMMQSVINGGAKALRLAGERDIKNAKSLLDVPVIGLTKPERIPDNWMQVVYITPTIKEVKELIAAGADIIAFDGTPRPRGNDDLKSIIEYIKANDKLSMADISTFEEGIEARKLGADIISTTLSGYTEYSQTNSKEPDFNLLEKLVKVVDCPVVLEGRIWTPEQVEKAFLLGAHSVVIGSAITRPQHIVKHFIERK